MKHITSFPSCEMTLLRAKHSRDDELNRKYKHPDRYFLTPTASLKMDEADASDIPLIEVDTTKTKKNYTLHAYLPVRRLKKDGEGNTRVEENTQPYKLEVVTENRSIPGEHRN